MKIYLGADHAGFELKEQLKKWLIELGHEVKDFGAFSFDAEDDYPDFVRPVAEAVAADSEQGQGIIIGGSGQAEAICANRLKGVRAAVFYGPVLAKSKVDANGRESSNPFEIVRLSRLHNNANILSLGSRFVSEEEAKKAIEIFLGTEFEGGRHKRRIEKIDN